MKRETLLAATKLLKDSASKGGQQLKDLQLSNSSVAIDEDTVRLGENVHKVRRLFFKNGDLQTIGWVVNEDIKQCMECSSKFHLLRRPHHCRSCGNLICQTCCRTATIDNLEELGMARICTRCYYAADKGSPATAVTVAAEELVKASAVVEESKAEEVDIVDHSVGVECDEVREEREMPAAGEESSSIAAAVQPACIACSALTAELALTKEMCAANEEDLQDALTAAASWKKKAAVATRRAEGNLAAATGQIRLLEGQVTRLKTELSAVSQDRSALQNQLQELQTAVVAKDALITALQEQLDLRRAEQEHTRHIVSSNEVTHSEQVVTRISHEVRFARDLLVRLLGSDENFCKDNNNVEQGDSIQKVLGTMEELLRLLPDAAVTKTPTASTKSRRVATPRSAADWEVGIDSSDYFSPGKAVTPIHGIAFH